MRGRYTSPDDTDLLQQIAALQQRVSDLEATAQSGSTSVDSGNLEILNGSLKVTAPGATDFTVHFGLVQMQDLTYTPGWIFKRTDGSIAFNLVGLSGGRQVFSFFDRYGSFLFGDDIDTGYGMAAPYIGFSNVRESDFTTPPITTTSGTFVTMFKACGIKQQPRIATTILLTNDAGTSCELQLRDYTTSTVISGPHSVGAGTSIKILVGDTSNLSAVHLGNLIVELQARRTAGAGSVRIMPLHSYGTDEAAGIY